MGNPDIKAFCSRVEVPFRDEGKGVAAIYDHVCLQQLGIATIYSAPAAQRGEASRIFRRQVLTEIGTNKKIKKNELSAFKFPQGVPTRLTEHNRHVRGLLFIPGRARGTKVKRPQRALQRQQLEERLLKEAALIGRPVLAVCAGCWCLWRVFSGRLRDTKDHAYRGGMPRLSAKGKIVNVKDVHAIRLCEDTLLHTLYDKASSSDTLFAVNSVHWKVVDERHIPDNLQISATARQDDGLTPRHSSGQGFMQPEEDVVEAFETCFGVPMIGVQYHPEAYVKSKGQADDTQESPHLAVLRYMIAAGEAFYYKRRMLRQFQGRLPPDLAGSHVVKI